MQESKSLDKLYVMQEIVDEVIKNVPAENIKSINITWAVMETSEEDMVVPELSIELSPSGIKIKEPLHQLEH